MTVVMLTSAEAETLAALVEEGPLWDGDVPSKAARDELIHRGYAAKIVVKGEDGYQAATYTGREAYKLHYGTSLGLSAGTIAEAKANRLAKIAVKHMKG